MVLLIRDEDVREAFTFEDAIHAVENVYRQHGKGLVQDTPRREVRIRGKDLPHSAAGTTSVGQGLVYLEEPNIVVLAHYFRFQKVHSAKIFPYERIYPHLFHIIDASDGALLAIVHSPYAIWMRTGATGAVGAKYLARKDSTTAGIIGTGTQGRAQLLFLSKVRKIQKAFAHSGRKKDELYANEMSTKMGINIVACDEVQEVVRNADILVTATRSTQPIVKGEWVRKGTHINAIGADDPKKIELDANTMRKADKIVFDSDRAITWIGHIATPIMDGILKQADIFGSISQVVAGLKPGRQDKDEITIFASEGTNMQTANVALEIYNKVKKMDLGIETSSLLSYFLL